MRCFSLRFVLVSVKSGTFQGLTTV